MPISNDILDTIFPRYLEDLVSVGEIGSGDTESESHRQFASGLSFPIGFKNGTDGNLGIAIDAVKAAKYPHSFLSNTFEGLAAIIRTSGNEDCFIILAGYYDAESIREAKQALEKTGLRARLMLDCGHGNSLENYRSQVKSAASRISSGDTSIMGVVIKSNISEGSFLVEQINL